MALQSVEASETTMEQEQLVHSHQEAVGCGQPGETPPTPKLNNGQFSSCDNLANLLSNRLSVTIRFGHSLDAVDEILSLELLEELQVSLKVLEKDRAAGRKENTEVKKLISELRKENQLLKEKLQSFETVQNVQEVPSSGDTIDGCRPLAQLTIDTNMAAQEAAISGNSFNNSPGLNGNGSSLLNSTNFELEHSLTEAHKEIEELRERLRYTSGESQRTGTPDAFKDDLSSPGSPRHITPPTRYRSVSSLSFSGGNSPSEAEKKTQLIGKQFSSLLSKVASDVRVLDSVKDIVAKPPIDTNERLQLIVDLLFEKALLESWDIARYVNLAGRLRHLSIYKANEDTGEKELVRFQKLLLGRCQREFEADPYKDIDVDRKQALIDYCEDPEQKMALIAALNEDKRQAMRKKLGNIKFIGELFMSNMGDGALVVHCLRKLAADLNDDKLELLCVLTRTVGKRLEKDYKVRGKFKDLEPFFKKLNQILVDKNTSERVRFFVQDLLEMRANNWTDRHAVTYAMGGTPNNYGSSGPNTPSMSRYSRSSRSSPMAPLTVPLSNINSISTMSLPWT